MKSWRIALVLALTVTPDGAAQGGIEFRKDNRDRIVSGILAAIAKETGATTAVSDSGSGKATSDMDVTGKMALRRPDGSIDNDLTPHFFETAKRLYPDGDFELDEYGSIRSKKLDTAVHDAKNAVPDFRSALPPEAFKVKYMAALQAKEQNPDAYFTAGGNKKQVEQRMQTKSRLRIFRPDGGTEDVVVDREKPGEYAGAMKKYFGMNPEEVTSRSHERDLFGDAFDAYRQAREPGHENDPQNIRGDPKYNTRIIDNFLEMNGYPPNWTRLTAPQKQDVLGRLFPDEAQAAGRAKIAQVLDASFAVYTNRDLAGMSAVGDQSDAHAFSEMFQRAAIAAMAEKRLPDLVNPNVTLRDLKDHAQALAQKAGESWGDLPKEEKLKYLRAARQQAPDLTEKLKFAAAGELATVFKSLDGMDSERAARFKEQILAKVSPEQRPYVQSQMELATAYVRDKSNTVPNSGEAVKDQKAALARVHGQLESRYLAEAAKQKAGGCSIRQLLQVGAATPQAYRKVQEDWEAVKSHLDPSVKTMAGTLDKLDKTQSVLNLVKIYQDSGGDPDTMKRAVYMEAMSRSVPGYDSYQMYKMWKSGDPRAQEEVQNSLVFQGLTMLPGGAFARGMKLAVDVAKAGLEVTIGYELRAMGDDTVRAALHGGTFDSILRGVPGQSVDAQRKNLYQTWKSELDLDVAFKRLSAQRKVWNSLLPYEKSDKANQERYLRTVRAFYETVNRRVTGKVDSYLAGTTRGGEVATGAKDKLTQLLFADFVNGLNRELGESLMNGLERDAAGSQTVLDEVDDYLFGLFSKSLDVALDELASADPARLPSSRWDLRFDTSTNELNATTHEVTVTSAVQAIPPQNPTFEERNTTYELLMPEGKELQTQVVNGHVKLLLRHPRTQAIVVEKDFRLGDVKPVPPDGPLLEREYWDTARKVLKREYQYVLEPGHVGGPARIRNGMERVYYQSGQLSYEATRKNNQLEGTMTRYWEDGHKFDVATYKAGDREGPYAAFHPNGKPRATGQFVHDRKVGAWKTYYSNGKIESEGAYPDKPYNSEPTGDRVPADASMTHNYADKGLYYDWGPRIGPWTFYYDSGRRRSEDGGSATRDGQPVSRTYYDNAANSPESESGASGSTFWYENGRVERKCPVVGDCRSWNSDGTEVKR